ncbi:MAG: hypothetical protein ACSHYF_10060 [Verrucomicrobiaceae bacterium]
MNQRSAATIPHPGFSAEKFSGCAVVVFHGLTMTDWKTRLYTTPGGNDF